LVLAMLLRALVDLVLQGIDHAVLIPVSFQLVQSLGGRAELGLLQSVVQKMHKLEQDASGKQTAKLTPAALLPVHVDALDLLDRCGGPALRRVPQRQERGLLPALWCLARMVGCQGLRHPPDHAQQEVPFEAAAAAAGAAGVHC